MCDLLINYLTFTTLLASYTLTQTHKPGHTMETGIIILHGSLYV